MTLSCSGIGERVKMMVEWVTVEVSFQRSEVRAHLGDINAKTDHHSTIICSQRKEMAAGQGRDRVFYVL